MKIFYRDLLRRLVTASNPANSGFGLSLQLGLVLGHGFFPDEAVEVLKIDFPAVMKLLNQLAEQVIHHVRQPFTAKSGNGVVML